MGLLDDAIREHLELKRRAGADATDVARQAQEALGPGGRDDPSGGSLTWEAEPHAGQDADGVIDPIFYEDEAAGYAEELPFNPPRPQPAAMPAPAPPSAPLAPPLSSVGDRPGPGPPTEEYLVLPAETEPDDVLEQTPDFLQETPEHDRLWFEQAPPQEFDFDK